MKLLIFTLISLLTCTNCVNAQISQNVFERYTIGETYTYLSYRVSDSIPDIANPSTWNSLKNYTINDTIHMSIEDPEFHDNGGKYSSADIVEVASDGTKVFVQLTDSLCQTVGFQSSSNNLDIEYLSPQTHMTSTLSQQNSYKSDYSCKFSSYGQQYSSKGQTEITYLTSGNLNWMGHSTDVQLICIRQSQVDTNLNTLQTSDLTTITYLWFAEEYKAPLIRYSSSKSSYGNYYSLSSLESIRTLSLPANTIEQLNVFPSPAKNIVYLPEECHFENCEIINVQGETIAVYNCDETQLNVSFLTPGKYFIHFYDSNNLIAITKFVKL